MLLFLKEMTESAVFLMYGIPNMKLEKHVIDRKIAIMKEEGVEFITGVNVGKDVKASVSY